MSLTPARVNNENPADVADLSSQPSSAIPRVDQGPWEYGGFRYVATDRFPFYPFEGGNVALSVHKTSDGINFAKLDQTNAPLANAGAGGNRDTLATWFSPGDQRIY